MDLEVAPEHDPDVTIGTLECGDMREVGKEAVFTISTAKIGNGVEQLRDGNLETFWQSDGTAPHLINIQFPHKMSISKVCLYMDFTVDESYTSKKITIRSGTTTHDLVDISAIELHKPVGWCQIRLRGRNGVVDADRETELDQPLRTHMLQIRVMSMHQGGKDTHIRQVSIYGPRPTAPTVFSTIDMQQFSTIR
jgi:anaphase-promoting complex subunit 10